MLFTYLLPVFCSCLRLLSLLWFVLLVYIDLPFNDCLYTPLSVCSYCLYSGLYSLFILTCCIMTAYTLLSVFILVFAFSTCSYYLYTINTVHLLYVLTDSTLYLTTVIIVCSFYLYYTHCLHLCSYSLYTTHCLHLLYAPTLCTLLTVCTLYLLYELTVCNYTLFPYSLS